MSQKFWRGFNLSVIYKDYVRSRLVGILSSNESFEHWRLQIEITAVRSSIINSIFRIIRMQMTLTQWQWHFMSRSFHISFILNPMKWRMKGEFILWKERIYSKNKCITYFQSGREPSRADSEPCAEQPSLLLLVWLLGRPGGGARVRVRRVRRLPGE